MKIYICQVLFLGLFLMPAIAEATVPAVYTQANFRTSTHEAPASFTQDEVGNFYGETVSGRPFSQVAVTNYCGVRLQKFTIDKAYFYISDRGVIFANTDLLALSIYFTRST